MPLTSYGMVFELQKRGFVLNDRCNVWIGPFGLRVSTIYTNEEENLGSTTNAVNISFARNQELNFVDEQLRDRRGQDRPPLVKPINRFDTNFNPTIRPQAQPPR